MKFKIPFAGSDIERLKKVSNYFIKRVSYERNSKLSKCLETSGAPLTREQYIGISRRSVVNIFFVLFFVFLTVLGLLRINFFYLFSLAGTVLFTGFVYFSQMAYPTVYSSKRQRDIERNLIPALQDMLIQLTSGIPLFNILVNLSDSDYGELSVEFKKAVRRINSGDPEMEVLEQLGDDNPSNYFKRALWQLSNGLRAGSDMVIVIQDNIRELTEEQMIQIQDYGNRLNPLIMFYMLISVIAPALSITFLTIISSLINLPKTITIVAFLGLFVFVVLVQIMFLGLIKSKRPSLLE